MENALENFTQHIKRSNIAYDRVVGIVRGGLVPAVRLSHKLEIPMHTIAWSLRDGKIQSQKDIQSLVEMLRSGKRVLIVEDIIDSGRTLNTIFDYIYQQLGDVCQLPEQLHVATLINNVDIDIVPKYTSISISRKTDETWYQFWWENKYRDETYSQGEFEI